MAVPCMSLVGLLQKKVDSCPLFAESLRRVVARDATRVRLAIYCDDAQGGNVMAAKATMNHLPGFCNSSSRKSLVNLGRGEGTRCCPL